MSTSHREADVPSIRVAGPEDGAAVAAVYEPFVVGTGISFETEAPAAAEMSRRIAARLRDYPWLVAEVDGRVVGYAYGSRLRERAAYDWSVEVSIYLAEGFHGRGIGRRLYGALLSVLRRQGYVTAYAGITLPHAASVGLHEALGFSPVGVYPRVGWKQGSWYDVGWWWLALRDPCDEPDPPVPFEELRRRADPLQAWVQGTSAP